MKKNIYIKAILLFIVMFTKLQASDNEPSLILNLENYLKGKKIVVNEDSIQKITSFIDSKEQTLNLDLKNLDLNILAVDFIKSSFDFTDDPMKDFIQLQVLSQDLRKLFSNEDYNKFNFIDFSEFIGEKLNEFTKKYPDFFINMDQKFDVPDIEPLSINEYLGSLDTEAKGNFYGILLKNTSINEMITLNGFKAELTAKIALLAGKYLPNDNKTLTDYLSFNQQYNNIKQKINQDTINKFDLEESFSRLENIYKNSVIVQAYDVYKSALNTFLANPTTADITALYNSINFKTTKIMPNGEKIENYKIFNDYLSDNAMFKNAVSSFDADKLSQLKSFGQERNFQALNNIIDKVEREKSFLDKVKQDLNLDKIRVIADFMAKNKMMDIDGINIDEILTGNPPKDSWFKNALTKIKRAFGLSKNIDKIDVTNFLERLKIAGVLNKNDSEIPKILKQTLLQDFDLMYKLLPVNAQFFIKQFNNLKDFKNELLKAYFQDNNKQVEFDEAFSPEKTSLTETEQADKQAARIQAYKDLINDAVKLIKNSGQQTKIINDLARNFSDYANVGPLFNLQSILVAALTNAEIDLPENMESYSSTQKHQTYVGENTPRIPETKIPAGQENDGPRVVEL